MASPRGIFRSFRDRFRRHWAERQHRNAYYLMLNSVTGAFAGLLFWFLLARLAGLPAAEIGVGYATVALGTIVAVVAKGGLDTALVRSVPHASRGEAARLLRFASLLAAWVAFLMVGILAFVSERSAWVPDATPGGWMLAAAIGILLVITWLQDAYFLADGEARDSFRRNLVFSVARLILPVPVILLALPDPVALTWALALGASALAAIWFARRLPHRDGRAVPRREFLVSATRNISGSAAEFLPGLLLAPLVLAIDGPAAAAYWGIAWTGASLLFLASAAISRSALAQMVRKGAAGQAHAIRRAARQHAFLVAPAAVLGAGFAPIALGIVGPDYAREGSVVLAILSLSALVVAPAYLYLALLRAREQPVALVLFPMAMILFLALLAPTLNERYGLVGVSLAWVLANTPFGAFAAWKLRLAAREVRPSDIPIPIGRPAHAE